MPVVAGFELSFDLNSPPAAKPPDGAEVDAGVAPVDAGVEPAFPNRLVDWAGFAAPNILEVEA